MLCLKITKKVSIKNFRFFLGKIEQQNSKSSTSRPSSKSIIGRAYQRIWCILWNVLKLMNLRNVFIGNSANISNNSKALIFCSLNNAITCASSLHSTYRFQCNMMSRSIARQWNQAVWLSALLSPALPTKGKKSTNC